MAIAEMLKANPTVTRIFLNNNQMGDEGAVAMFGALEQNPYIRYMEVGFGDAEDAMKKLLDRNQRIANRAKVAENEAITLLLCVNCLARQKKEKQKPRKESHSKSTSNGVEAQSNH